MSRSSIVVVGLLAGFVVRARVILACSDGPRETVRPAEPRVAAAIAIPTIAQPRAPEPIPAPVAEPVAAPEPVRGARVSIRTAMTQPESHARTYSVRHEGPHKKAAVHHHRAAPKRAPAPHAPKRAGKKTPKRGR